MSKLSQSNTNKSANRGLVTTGSTKDLLKTMQMQNVKLMLKNSASRSNLAKNGTRSDTKTAREEITKFQI
jgi:hypothetical protein